MKKGFLVSTPPPSTRKLPATPTTATSSRSRPQINLNTAIATAAKADHLLASARLGSTAVSLRDHGYAVLALKGCEHEVIRSAVADADKCCSAASEFSLAHAAGVSLQSVERPNGRKQILSVGRSPLHAAKVLLQKAADAALEGVAAMIGVPAARFGSLVGEHEESILSAMRYDSGIGGCEEHEDRGLLTIVAGPGVRTLELYDRVASCWLTPSGPFGSADYVVVFAGATLHRATAGLVPCASDAAMGIGATLHRVPPLATNEPRQSLVLRVRASPSATFQCGELGAMPGAIERFVAGNETVAEYIASKHYSSVNESVTTTAGAPSASAAMVPNATLPRAAAAHINLKLVTQDGNEIFFKCKPTAPLGKRMNAFCQRQGVAFHSKAFLFAGHRINEDEAPSDLGMEDGDVINVEETQNELLTLFKAHPFDQRFGEGYIKRDVYSMEPLRNHLRFDADACYFFAKVVRANEPHALPRWVRGCLLDGSETPSSMGMGDGDILLEVQDVVEAVFDIVSERCLERDLLTETALDRVTDTIAALRGINAPPDGTMPSSGGRKVGLPHAMLGHIQSLYLLLAFESSDPAGCFEESGLMFAEVLLRQILRSIPEAGSWCASVLALLNEAELDQFVRRKENEYMRSSNARTLYFTRRERRQRAEAAAEAAAQQKANNAADVLYASKANRRAEAARRWYTEVRAFLVGQLNEDAADQIMSAVAIKRLISAARSMLIKAHERRAHINLKVVTQDGNEIFFKCKPTTPLGKLMNAFCQRQGVSLASVRFLFDGTRINEFQTPSDLDMEDGDVIDVMAEQVGD